MKIAILSHGRTIYSTQRLAEAGRRRGHDIRIIDPMRCLSFINCHENTDVILPPELVDLPEENLLYPRKPIDRTGLTLYQDGLPLKAFDAIIPRVGAASPMVYLELLRHFEMMGVRSLSQWRAIELCRDKFLTAQILAFNGIPVPRSITTCDPDSLEHVIKYLGGMPIVIKVKSGTQGSGVIISDTVMSFTSTTQMLWGLKQEIFFQEFIAESKGTDIRVFVVAGRVVGAMKRQAVREDEFRANVHLGAEVEPITLDPETRQLALKAVSVVGLAVAGVDIIMTSRGPLILEINASPGLKGIEAATGVDIARTMIKAVEEMFDS